MKTVIETSFGQQENRDIIINDVSLTDVTPQEEKEAVSNGFLVHQVNNEDVWYLSRSTRVHIPETNYKEYNEDWHICHELTMPMWINHQVLHCDKEVLQDILNAYIKKHSFTDFGYALLESHRTKFFLYYQNKKLVAFTKMQFYHEDVETYLFAWDYKNPELRLGEVTLQHEIAWAKKLRYEYLYTGSGYERSSIYKADVDGFEWWTGMGWSRDVNRYKELCKRDSKLRSFKALTTHL